MGTSLRLSALTVMFVVCGVQLAQTGVPPLLNFQGRLADSIGTPVADGVYSIEFRIYDDSVGGSTVWNETQASVQVAGGLFSGLLGSVNPIVDDVFASTDRWLAMRIDDGPESTPRTRLVSVGYAHRIGTIDGASGGKVLGRTTLSGVSELLRLESGQSGAGAAWRTVTGGASLRVDGNLAGSDFDGGFRSPLGLYPSGAVSVTGDLSIGSSIVGGVAATGGSISILSESVPISIDVKDQSGPGSHWRFATSGTLLRIDGNSSGDDFSNFRTPLAMAPTGDLKTMGSLFVGAQIVGGVPPTPESLVVNGNTITEVLTITGGSDLAEPFEISGAGTVTPGSIVVIDEVNAGRLTLSSIPYDRRVAGIVSGAGGIKPGLTLHQQGLVEGSTRIALSGRVYAMATTENGAIAPGDLLTTSSIPGHAMKVTDHSLAMGAVIGKAMTALESGEGSVLVLVSLQ